MRYLQISKGRIHLPLDITFLLNVVEMFSELSYFYIRLSDLYKEGALILFVIDSISIRINRFVFQSKKA